MKEIDIDFLREDFPKILNSMNAGSDEAIEFEKLFFRSTTFLG